MYLTQKPSEGNPRSSLHKDSYFSLPGPDTTSQSLELRWSKYPCVGLWTQCHTWGWETLGPSTALQSGPTMPVQSSEIITAGEQNEMYKIIRK